MKTTCPRLFSHQCPEEEYSEVAAQRGGFAKPLRNLPPRYRTSLLPWRSSAHPRPLPGLPPKLSSAAAAPCPRSTALRSGSRAVRCHRVWRRSWPSRSVAGSGSSPPMARGCWRSTPRKRLGLQDARRELLPSPSRNLRLLVNPFPTVKDYMYRDPAHLEGLFTEVPRRGLLGSSYTWQLNNVHY